MSPEQLTLTLPPARPTRTVRSLSPGQIKALQQINITPRWVMDIGPGMVARLQKRGLVKAIPHAQEASRMVCITPLGKSLLITQP